MGVRGAGIIPTRVCACLVLAIGDRTSGYPVMTAIGATRMAITRLISDNRWIGVSVRGAGIIPTRVCACLSVAIGH